MESDISANDRMKKSCIKRKSVYITSGMLVSWLSMLTAEH